MQQKKLQDRKHNTNILLMTILKIKQQNIKKTKIVANLLHT